MADTSGVERSEPTRACWQFLEIDGFRGFADRQHLALDANAVVVQGANGTGKTSMFDALQWLLIGDVPRLRQLRYRQTEEHIVNVYRAQAKDPARVSAELLIANTAYQLSRVGDRSGSDLTLRTPEAVVEGTDAEGELGRLLSSGLASTLEEALFTSGLLQQDDMRLVLFSDPSKRFEQMSRLLGLNELEGFEEAAVAASKAEANRQSEVRELAQRHQSEVDAARAALADWEKRDALAPVAGQLLDALSRDLSSSDLIAVPPPLDAAEVGDLVVRLRLLEDRLRTLVAQTQALDEVPARSVTELDSEVARSADMTLSAQQRATKASAAVETLDTAVRSAREALTTRVALATAALPLLGPVCPVCQQAINDPPAVAADLRRRVSDDSNILALEEQRARATEELRAAEAQVAEALAAERYLSRQSNAAKAWRDVRLSLSSLTIEGVALGPTPEPLSPQLLLSWLTGLAEETSRARQRSEAALSALQSAERGSPTGMLRVRLSEAEENLDQARVRVEQAAQRALRASQLAKASTRARQQVIERRIQLLRPLAEDVYSRLSPHPTFDSFAFQTDVLRNKGTLSPRAVDPEGGVSVNPSLAFSSAQVNMVALTYFIAMAWSTGSNALPFICFDDPLQELDDVNVLAFSDLARHLRNDRQVMVATHDARYAQLLQRKLAPRQDGESTVTIRFEGWNRQGPVVSTERFEWSGRQLRLLA